jgi:hypothetical protein
MKYTGSALQNGDIMQNLKTGDDFACVVYVPSLNVKNVTMTLGELKTRVGQDETLRMMARQILQAAAVMQHLRGDFSSWKMDDNYVSFEIEVQGEETVLKNASIHVIADTLLDSYPDCRRTVPAVSWTTAQDIRATVDGLKQICDFDVDAELDRFKNLLIEGKTLHAEEGEIVVDDDLIAGSIQVFEEYVVNVGNKGKKGWKAKADEFRKLEKYIRENLAVNRQSFCFLERGKLSDHEVKWKIGGEVKDIKWVKLLIAYGDGRGDSLGVIRKKRQYFKETLDKIVELGHW